jgi:cytochrome c5
MGRGMMGGMPSRDVVPPGTRPEDLPSPESRGAALVNQYCTQCHNLPSPLLHSAAEWPQVVERMRQNITTLKRTPFTSAEREAIVRYLQEHARNRSPEEPRRLTDSTSPE